MSGSRLRVLMVEDVPEDAETNALELRRHGIDLDWRRVDTEAGLLHELVAFRPRLVLSDHGAPELDGMTALGICLERAPGIPFIVVTGSENAEAAVECLKAGAADYVTKSHLRRLARAVESALRTQEELAERVRAAERLRLQAAALEAVGHGIVITDRNGIVEWVNPAFTAMTGYPLEEIVGRNPRVLNSGLHRQGFFRELWEAILDGRTWRGEFENRRKDGTTFPQEMTIAPVRILGGPISHFIAVQQDISVRRRLDDELQRLGTVDPLTRLMNRASFSVRLDAAVAQARSGRPAALVLLDLDRFRVVNDMEGHSAGDHMLVLLAERLAAALRPDDVLARLGGDEFAAILADPDAGSAVTTAENLRAAIGQFRFTSGEHDYVLTASAGLAEIDGRAPAELLLARADEALHAAKELGADRTVAWGSELEGRAPMSEARSWAAQLKEALRDDRLVLHYQPVVSLGDGRTLHHEALVRILMADGTIVPPGAFLPAAERFGLMPQVDRRVVEKCLEVLARRPDVNLFVNLSGGSLTDEALLAWIEGAVSAAALAPRRLTFEITETIAVSDLVRVQRGIRCLRQLGCGFAIDDFGTGFSSFGYLRSLPVDEVKIDGSYVSNIDRDPTSRALVHAMVSVSHALGKRVVAEMVDRESVAIILREFGVEYGQGWLWGHAAPEPVPGFA